MQNKMEWECPQINDLISTSLCEKARNEELKAFCENECNRQCETFLAYMESVREVELADAAYQKARAQIEKEKHAAERMAGFYQGLIMGIMISKGEK